jgi:predicted CXXCH cytochrome family protein
MRVRHTGAWASGLLGVLCSGALAVAVPAHAGDADCLECHATKAQVLDAASALGVTLNDERAGRLVVTAMSADSPHNGTACADCHPKATEIPHPSGMLAENPCLTCHEDALAAVNKSTHGDPGGGAGLRASCANCHGAHDVRRVKDAGSLVSASHVAQRCLQCHDKSEYLEGVHGRGVEFAGLDIAATCVSCHGGHDILSPKVAGSRVARRNISFTCGKCHGRLAETYRSSVHGAALMATDNPDVPTCVDCHEAHGTVDPRSPRFRQGSPQICGKCHADATMMARYGLSTDVFSTYVADFHGTTAELFRAATPDQPLNQAVCYDCHGQHDIVSVRKAGGSAVESRLLSRCQHCHPGASATFLSAWTGHYVPSPTRYPLIYWVRVFYNLVIPSTVGFFLLYIAIDVWGRRRQRRSS